MTDPNKQSGSSPGKGGSASVLPDSFNPTLKSPKKVQRAFSGLAGSPLAQINEGVAEPAQATVVTMDPPKSAAAIRAAKWRERQKQQDPDFDKKEAERKGAERAEIERVQEIEETLRSNPAPAFVMKDAPQGEGLLVTGGYDSERIEVVNAAHEAAKTGRRVVPKGFGSRQLENTAAKELPKEFEDSFAPKFKNPREVRLLHQFIYENTKRSPMLVCLSCKDQIGSGEDPGENMMAGLLHFRHKHPDLYKIFVGRLKGTACAEDHDGMVRRHGGGTLKVQCKRCKKILYKPPKARPEQRSDRIIKTAA